MENATTKSLMRASKRHKNPRGAIIKKFLSQKY